MKNVKRKEFGRDRTKPQKRTLALIGLFLLCAAAVLAVRGEINKGMRVSFQYLPGLVVGAGSMLLLFFTDALNKKLLGASLYGLAGSLITVIWSLASGIQTKPFLRLDKLGFEALFAQSEFLIKSADFGTFAPFSGSLTAFVVGCMLTLSVLSFVHTRKEPRQPLSFKPNMTAVLCLLLPLAAGFAEYALQNLILIAQRSLFSKSGNPILVLFMILAAYLLLGLLAGLIYAKGSASRIVSVLILVLSLTMWFVVIFALMGSKNLWLSSVNSFSLFTSGVFFGFCAGVSLKMLCAKREKQAD